MKQHTALPTRPVRHILSASALGLLGALAASACQGAETHDLGFTLGAQDLTSEPSEPFFTTSDDFIGRWVGEATDPLALGADPTGEPPIYAFPSGSTRIVLEITRSDSDLTGSLAFGAGEPPPPATDPDLGYPVGFNWGTLVGYDDQDVHLGPGFSTNYDLALPPVEGFVYSLGLDRTSADALPDGVLGMRYTTSELVGSWCELQTPHSQTNGTFGPLPYNAGGGGNWDGTNKICHLYGPPDLSACPENLSDLPVEHYFEVYFGCFQEGEIVAEMSCDKVYLSQFCECYDDGCGAGFGADPPGIFLRTSGDGLVGVFDNASFMNPRGLSVPLGEVRFRRLSE